MEAVIVTHNSAEDLANAITSSKLLGAFSRVIVVDNASVDDTREIAASAGLEVMARSLNDGFGAGANAGIGATSGDVVALLNPDIHVLDEQMVRRLEDQFDEPDVGLVAPALQLPDGRIQDSAREVPAPLDLIRRRVGGHQLGRIEGSTRRDVPWVVGAFMTLRRRAFEEVGGFDTRYHLYFEDVDLCVRLNAAGWRVRFDPESLADHKHRGASRKSLVARATREHIRSAGMFYCRHPRYVLPRYLAGTTGRR